MGITKVLADVQSKLKAPKGQWNKFSKYYYRNCEDIIEAVKPLLAEHNAILLITDEVVMIGDRYYVKATVTVTCGDAEHVSTTAYARETLERKGMDDAQLTGATSSYARKYALNGLFAIDDTKDADNQDNRTPKKDKPKVTPAMLKNLEDAAAMDMTELEIAWKALSQDERNAIGADKLKALKEIANAARP